jgi:GT2 family glycosyltransferase
MSSSECLPDGSGPQDGPLFASRAATQVLVVILNFNGIEDTLGCLGSLRGQTCRDMAVLVIDNGSTADDLGRIATCFPEVEVLALPENLGWAGGNNVGIRQALDRGYEYVCLLNNDTVLDPTALQELLDACAALARPCLLHPTIAYFDDPTKWQLNPQPLPPTVKALRDLESPADIVEMDMA